MHSQQRGLHPGWPAAGPEPEGEATTPVTADQMRPKFLLMATCSEADGGLNTNNTHHVNALRLANHMH